MLDFSIYLQQFRKCVKKIICIQNLKTFFYEIVTNFDIEMFTLGQRIANIILVLLNKLNYKIQIITGVFKR